MMVLQPLSTFKMGGLELFTPTWFVVKSQNVGTNFIQIEGLLMGKVGAKIQDTTHFQRHSCKSPDTAIKPLIWHLYDEPYKWINYKLVEQKLKIKS